MDPTHVCRKCGYDLSGPAASFGPLQCPECGYSGYPIAYRRRHSVWFLAFRSCWLCWAFLLVSVLLLLLGDAVQPAATRRSTAAPLPVIVPAFASMLMGVALGIIMPLDTARDDHTNRPWDPRRRGRAFLITVTGWGLNLLFGIGVAATRAMLR
ncbi:MAG: hypothetical protein AMXMBFR58_03670 [Phycisphaerae bacterium]|nr:hypothetical protein [Phycisphaerales bacterium]MCK6477507.1 hypothetical protein [Phycisphaerales bacterium]